MAPFRLGLRGINYDVGTEINEHYCSRPTFDADQSRQEMRIIRDDLHCNAVRIIGTDLNRLTTAAEAALDLGLEVWLSPQLHDHSPEETLAYVGESAQQAERLRRQADDRLVFVIGSELTWFMRGLMPGSTFEKRVMNPLGMLRLRYGKGIGERLQSFLDVACDAVAEVYQGPTTYASAPIERVCWTEFDYVSLAYYRGAKNHADYGDRLQRHFAHGKPVIITEVGLCAYEGAEDRGGRGFAITDVRDGKLYVKPSVVRDEALQSRELIDMLTILQGKGVSGTFAFTFATPALTHNAADASRDLDLASFSLVKTLEFGLGTRYPAMPWEPKLAFDALAGFYAACETAAGNRDAGCGL